MTTCGDVSHELPNSECKGRLGVARPQSYPYTLDFILLSQSVLRGRPERLLVLSLDSCGLVTCRITSNSTNRKAQQVLPLPCLPWASECLEVIHPALQEGRPPSVDYIILLAASGR